ncbi:MAG TPA: triose-phosphate isomerase [Kofleriaceae bacterium]|jgi:triosephosphate isomerase|nr:triose-phosphate isomerase [Kofleriaceae bacterium]
MRTKFVVGNWKLHKTIAEGVALVTELKNQLGTVRDVEIGVAPSFLAVHAVAKRLEGTTIETVAQDCHWEASGAWTGEVSAAQLADAGATWVIVGHSERRQFFGDTNDGVGKKARSVIAAGLGAIVCVGEMLADRDAGRTLDIIDAQLAGGLAGIDPAKIGKLVVAYEPVWAIGTGRTATPAQAQEVHAHIRTRLAERFGAPAAGAIRIQYGGSVKPANAHALMSEPDIDGALVGGASLDAADFVGIVKGARPG